jgi:hypothetical protein
MTTEASTVIGGVDTRKHTHYPDLGHVDELAEMIIVPAR